MGVDCQFINSIKDFLELQIWENSMNEAVNIKLKLF